jgi:hypothetical protein
MKHLKINYRSTILIYLNKLFIIKKKTPKIIEQRLNKTPTLKISILGL